MQSEAGQRGEPEKKSYRSYGDVSLPGISEAALLAFCDAIELALYDSSASDADERRLRETLNAIAREAHQAGMTPERLLIGLKVVWTKVCGHFPDPDVMDRRWDRVVRGALTAYEQARPL